MLACLVIAQKEVELISVNKIFAHKVEVEVVLGFGKVKFAQFLKNAQNLSFLI